MQYRAGEGCRLAHRGRELWPEYYKGIWRLTDPFEVDTVVVDGRFRVSCVLGTILRCNSSVKIMVHDWERAFYHVLLQHADVVSL